jgi:hypothetical protein
MPLLVSVRGRPATWVRGLHRGTDNCAVRTKDAAMTWLRSKQRAAAGAFVVELTCIRRHRLTPCVPALGACYGRLQFHRGFRIPLFGLLDKHECSRGRRRSSYFAMGRRCGLPADAYSPGGAGCFSRDCGAMTGWPPPCGSGSGFRGPGGRRHVRRALLA